MYTTGAIGYLLLTAGGLGFFIVIVLTIRKRALSYYFFSVGLLVKSASTVMLGLMETRVLLAVPGLFLLPQPFQYLLGPAYFYFVVFTLNPKYRFKWWEMVHLIPFLLHLIEMMPFYLSDTDYKVRLIREAYQGIDSIRLTQYGIWLDYFQHLFLKAFFATCYAIAGAGLLFRNYRRAMEGHRTHNKVLYRWLSIELTLSLMVEFSIMVKSVWNEGAGALDPLVNTTLSLDMIVSFGFIILNPSILGGTRPFDPSFRPIPGDPQGSGKVEETMDGGPAMPLPPPTVRERSTQFLVIENYLQSRKPFIRLDLSRVGLAQTLRMSPRKLSEEIKSSTGMSFSDYVNSYRIQYLEENIRKRPEWAKFTIDAIGSEIGFATRVSFYNATKRHRSQTPTELLRNLGMDIRNQ